VGRSNQYKQNADLIFIATCGGNGLLLDMQVLHRAQEILYESLSHLAVSKEPIWHAINVNFPGVSLEGRHDSSLNKNNPQAPNCNLSFLFLKQARGKRGLIYN